MKVLILKDGKTAEVNDSYGARMIEQGKAVIPPKDEPKEEPAQDVSAMKEAPAKDTKGAKRR